MKHIISLGAGVQSSTMALMAAHGEITPMPVAAIFADTQAEPKAVYEWLDWLETKLPFPVHRVTAGDLAADSTRLRISKKTGTKYQRSAPPAYTRDETGKVNFLMRQCTGTHKLEPIKRALRKICGKDEQITQWVGISRDEAQRMKPAREPWLVTRWPLIEERITRAKCIAWMERNDYPTPPRSACYFCPYHSNREWIELRDEDPEAFAAAVDYERKLQVMFRDVAGYIGTVHLHKSCQPLDTIDFDALTDDPQLSLFGNECEGMCGV